VCAREVGQAEEAIIRETSTASPGIRSVTLTTHLIAIFHSILIYDNSLHNFSLLKNLLLLCLQWQRKRARATDCHEGAP